MKKYFSWIACAFLVLCALIFPNTGTAVAGKGNGRSEKVTSVQEVGEVLNAFRSDLQMMSATGEQGGKIAPLGKQFASDSDKEYTSVTLEFETTASVSVKTNMMDSSSMKMERTMTCYYTENEAFYEASANITSSSGGTVGSALSISFKIYISEDDALVYFERFTGRVKGGEDPELPDGVLHKWIDLDSEAASLVSINDANYAIMGVLGEYILNCEGEDFKKIGSNYTLKEDEAKELCSKVSSESSVGGVSSDMFKEASFSVDLSSKTSPFMRLVYTAKQSIEGYDQNGNRQKYTMKGAEKMDCRLKNINNTVIKFKVPDKVYRISDFE